MVMKKILLLLFCLPFLTATMCEPDDHPRQINCTDEARAGLNVSVSLGDQNSITAEGVTVVATDGNYSEELVAYNDIDPVFSGAYERPGNYVITVSKEGYHTYTTEIITVNRDVCHVIPRIIHVSLQPII
jgi:hypothetical protein